MRTSLAALFVAGGLAACGNDDDGAASSTTDAAVAAEFNEADVQFASDMIPHHRQAVEMAAIALDPSVEAGDNVQELARRIEQAQEPEIKLMTGWLDAWGQPASAETAATGDVGDMGDMGDMGDTGATDGMMTDDEMKSLADLRGDEFDQTWMEMMTRHHEGAIAMAKTEIDDGANPEAIELATQIVDAQQAEIDEMRKLLDT